METLLPPPKLTHLFILRCNVEQPLDIGQVSSGRRRWVPIVGGSVSGKDISGDVVGGEDSMYGPLCFGSCYDTYVQDGGRKPHNACECAVFSQEQ